MFTIFYMPVFSEKYDIVLPERRRGASTTDQSVFAENGCKVVGLKVIDLLASDKINRVFPKQPGHQLFAMFPGIGPILCQAETKVEGHYRKAITVMAHLQSVHDG